MTRRRDHSRARVSPARSGPTPRRVPWKTVGPAVALVVLAVVAFANALPTELVYDAVPMVQENPLLREASPWWKLLVTDYWAHYWYSGAYRPLTTLSFRLERNTLGFGRDARGYVVVNLLLHVTMTLGLWRLGRRWLGAEAGAITAAALLAVHPVATEIVPNVVGRGDLLAALGALGAVLAWERGDGPRGGRWRWAAAGLWLLGLLGKESPVALPALLLLRDAARAPALGEGGWGPRLRRFAPRYAPIAAAAVAYGAVRLAMLPPSGLLIIRSIENPLVVEPPLARVLTAVKLIGLYVGKASCLVPLSVEYGYDQIQVTRSVLEAGFLGGAAALVALGVVTALCWRRGSPAALGLAWFCVMLLPVSNLLGVIGTIMADRLLYLPIAGLCLAAGAAWAPATAGLARRLGPVTARLAAPAVAALAVAVLGGLTLARNPVWRTNVGFWSSAVQTAPRSVRAHHFLAKNLDDRVPDSARLEESVRHAERALELLRGLGEDFQDVHANLAAYYTKMARRAMPGGRLTPEAEAWLAKALAVLRESEALDRPEGRRYAAWRDAVARTPRPPGVPAPVFGHAQTQQNLGVALFTLGRFDEAVRPLERAHAMAPADGEIAYTLGGVLFAAGRWAEAEAAFTRALVLRPGHEDTLLALGYTRLRRGDYGPAVDALGRAVAVRPGPSQARTLLAQAFVAWVAERLRAGDSAGARRLATRAVTIHGVDPALFTRLLGPDWPRS
jgi:tetratricopeptide (TPR) repeat protein